MILFELAKDGSRNSIIEGDLYMVEIMLLLEAVGKRLQKEDGTDWRVHILNMAEVVANPDISADQINDVVMATSEGRRWKNENI